LIPLKKELIVLIFYQILVNGVDNHFGQDQKALVCGGHVVTGEGEALKIAITSKLMT
jgi:hypothetical protein